jgi:RND family efflux transporter MFP subunit
MRLWKQAALSLLLLTVAAVFWVRHFPVAANLLERAGLAPPTAEAPAAEAMLAAAPGASAPIVLGAEAGRATLEDSISAIGDGRAARSATLTPSSSGRVAEVLARSGDRVEAGAPLVKLDSETEEIALARAELILADAHDTLARTRRLASASALSEVQVRTAELAVGEAELAARDARLALDRRTVRAPFDGFIGFVDVDTGDHVDTATPVATIDDRSEILVDFRVPERFVGRVGPGDPVAARPLAMPGIVLDGTVATLDSRIDTDTRTLRVQARLDNADDRLRPGMAFSIRMDLPGPTYAAVDPLAIQWSADGAYVWTLAEGGALRVPVEIVQRRNDAVLVAGPLAPGTMVVTQGVQLLRPGAPFRFEGAALPAAAEEGAVRPAASRI